jgi:hypothetical protein
MMARMGFGAGPETNATPEVNQLFDEWVGQIDWSDRRVYVELNRDDIESSPEYTSQALSDPEFADRVDEHYAGVRAFCEPDSHECQPVLGP